MAYGMTYDEFWYDSPYRAKFYREARQIAVKQKDEELWLQGVYIYDALCRVSPILHAFSKSGTKALPYMERPLSFNNDALKSRAEKEKEAENERLKAQVQFSIWARAVSNKFKKKEE